MQRYSNHLFQPFRMDDEDEPKENGKEEKAGLWCISEERWKSSFLKKELCICGVCVDDKSAKDIVTKFVTARCRQTRRRD